MSDHSIGDLSQDRSALRILGIVILTPFIVAVVIPLAFGGLVAIDEPSVDWQAPCPRSRLRSIS